MPLSMPMERWWRRLHIMTMVMVTARAVALRYLIGLGPRLASSTPVNTCPRRSALARTTRFGPWDGVGQATPARTTILFLGIIRQRDRRWEHSSHAPRSRPNAIRRSPALALGRSGL